MVVVVRGFVVVTVGGFVVVVVAARRAGPMPHETRPQVSAANPTAGEPPGAPRF